MTERIEIIAGPARSGKKARLLATYGQTLCRLPLPPEAELGLWLSPTQRAASDTRDKLVASVGRSLLAPNIKTFADFAESIVGSGRRPIRSISALQKKRILRLVVDRLLREKKLRHFAPVATMPGFLDEIDRSISEMKRRDLWPENFAKRSQRQRDRELAAIYSAYQTRLTASHLYDAEGRFWVAREMLAEQQVGFGTIVVDGFVDFTSAQVDILKLLAQRCEQLLISLTLDPDLVELSDHDTSRSLMFTKPRATLEKLQEIFPALEISWQSQFDQIPATLRHLEQNLFRDQAPNEAPRAPLRPLEIIAANSTLGEVEEVARRVKRLLQEGHARPDEIVVVFCRLNEAASRVSDIFSDFGIPHALETRTKLRSTPLVRALVMLVRTHLEDWPFRRLLDVVGNRLFRALDVDGERPVDTTVGPRVAIETMLRSAQLPSGRQKLLDQLEYWAANAVEGREDRSIDASVARDKLRFLAGCLDELPQRASLEEWIESLRCLLSRLGTLAMPNNSEYEAGDKIAWSALRGALRSIDQSDRWAFPDREHLTALQMLDLIEMVSGEQRLPTTHDPIGSVRVLSAESARRVAAQHLFLAGLNEQAFSDLQSDAQAADRSDADQGDPMLLFYDLVTRATQSLTLSYPALDDKGQSLPASPMLTELERCFEGVAISRMTMPLGGVVLTNGLSDGSPQSRSDFRQQAVARALEGDSNWLAALMTQPPGASAGVSVVDGLECIAQRGDRDRFGEYEGLLESDAARTSLAKRFDAAHLWSSSQLESYATCPFRFFAEQLLSLKPLEELTLRSDAARRGSLAHQVLATIHLQLRDLKEPTKEPINEAEPELVKRFLHSLDEIVAARPLGGLAQALREIERREIAAWAPLYAEQEQQYRAQWDHLDQPLRPAYFEMRFGSEARSGEVTDGERSTPLPFELDLGDERICLTGQIDRIDLGRVGNVTVFNIIDYKTGQEVKFKADNVETGRQLQLPLYALAVEQHLLADQQPQGLSAGYWNIKAQGFKSGKSGPLRMREIDDQQLHATDQWNELQATMLDRVQQIVAGIRHGEFPVDNDDEHCTRSCSLRTICRVGHIRSLQKKWKPPTPSQSQVNHNDTTTTTTT